MCSGRVGRRVVRRVVHRVVRRVVPDRERLFEERARAQEAELRKRDHGDSGVSFSTYVNRFRQGCILGAIL